LYVGFLSGEIRILGIDAKRPAPAVEALAEATRESQVPKIVHDNLVRRRDLEPAVRDAALRMVSVQSTIDTEEHLDVPLLLGGGSRQQMLLRLTWAEDYVERAPLSMGVLGNLGMAQFRAGRPKEAVATLERVMAVWDDPVAAAFLAMSYSAAEQPAKARAALERARALAANVDEMVRVPADHAIAEAANLIDRGK
jgi:tetratricopeptide (TPR) repeat protein